MAQFPGKSERISAPYSKAYSSFAAAVNLTTEINQARNATSGFVVATTPSTGAGNLVYKDCAGSTVTVALAAGVVVELPVAATSLEISTISGVVLAYWHPSTAT